VAQALRIAIDGTVTDLSWEDGKTLEALQAGVEGSVDLVALRPDVDMWANDEGLFTHDVNVVGTLVADALRGDHWQDYHGPLVFTGGNDEEGRTLPLSEAAQEEIRGLAERALAFVRERLAG